jgi:hypothetical protein
MLTRRPRTKSLTTTKAATRSWRRSLRSCANDSAPKWKQPFSNNTLKWPSLFWM